MPWVVLLAVVGVAALRWDWFGAVVLGLALLPYVVVWHLVRADRAAGPGEPDRYVRDIGPGGP